MATLTIRNLDPAIKERLRIRAAHNGRSMEAELRAIVTDAIGPRRRPERSIWPRPSAAASRRSAASTSNFRPARPRASRPRSNEDRARNRG
jgi:antitoxin FitA